jgi:hypothetical protein
MRFQAGAADFSRIFPDFADFRRFFPIPLAIAPPPWFTSRAP